MPKKKKLAFMKEGGKPIHPESRRAKQISKSYHRDLKMDKRRIDSSRRQKLIAKKLLWFKENLDQNKDSYKPEDIAKLIEGYIERYSEENKLIELKNSIGKRSINKQNLSRQDSIKMTYEKELNEYDSGAFEMIDLRDHEEIKKFKAWKGEGHIIDSFKITTYNKNKLMSESLDKTPEETTQSEELLDDVEMKE